jgi:signal transduction histidine kinase
MLRTTASTKGAWRGRLNQANGRAHAHGRRRGSIALAQTRPARSWFERRTVVLVTAACLTVVVFMVREVFGNRLEMFALFYVVPVALVGLELGLRAGVAAVFGTLLLVAVRPPSHDVGVDALGLMTRGVALLAVGAIAGRFSDRMREANERLQEQFRSAGHVLGVHERERRGIAEQLHDQAAQTMAATLLLVGHLDRSSLDELTQAQLEEIRSSTRHCIAHLRELASTLRPPVLDELGLVPALERSVQSRENGTALTVELQSNGHPRRLPRDTETLAYRAIEEVMSCMTGTIVVHMAQHASRLAIDMDGSPCERTPEHERDLRLATTRARLEIIGGTMASSLAGGRIAVTAEIPVVAEHDDA